MTPPRFRLALRVDDPPAVVWTRLWDLDRHTESIPLTRVWSVDGGPLGNGSRFVGRTRIGPVALDDRMVVEAWEPPRRAVIRKVGPVFRGRIEVTLRPTVDGTRIDWSQTYGARFVPDALARLLKPVLRSGYRSSLRQIVGGGESPERPR